MDPNIAQLLKLQEIDLKLTRARNALQALPREMAGIERRIAEEKEQLATREQALKNLEVRRKEIDGELQSTEEQIVKYKTQQLQVKKNEEFTALTHEIETLSGKVSTYEEEEIELMLKIDEEKAAMEGVREASRQRLADLDGEMKLLNQRKATMEGELEGLDEQLEAERGQSDNAYLAGYEKAKQRAPRGPFVVLLEDAVRCTGCHLKVSGEITAAARQPKGPIQCDQCGRLVYVG